MTERIHTIGQLRNRCDDWRRSGLRVGLVPTMGALHQGHLSLVRAVRDGGADRVVTTIFVNPLQFGQGEDLDRYPRTLDADVGLLAQLNVDVAFAPTPSEMYPKGFQTHVEVTEVTRLLEGAFRPHHFQGVTTVVAKLFNIVGPSIAAFGQKDYQQWRVLAQMVADLAMPIEVLGCPIVRDDDGLAMSSRNRYLTADQRARALAISEGLAAAESRFRDGERDEAILRQVVEEPIRQAFDRIDYVTIADADSLQPVIGTCGSRSVILVAAHLGATRLIDNRVLSESP